MADQSIGFIGMGRMGGRMARRFVDRGWQVYGADPDPEVRSGFASVKFVSFEDAPCAVALRATTTVLSLPSPQVYVDVVEASGGLAHANGSGRTIIDTSTSGLSTARRCAARLVDAGYDVLDAPVSGGISGAEQGTLSVMAAGSRAKFDEHFEILKIIGENVFFVGDQVGQGQVMKVVNNILSLSALSATAEATAVARKAGISLSASLDILNVSSGRNTATSSKFPHSVVTRSFNFGFPISGALKDAKLFEAAAEELGVPTIACNGVVNTWRMAAARGYGDDDFTAIAKVYEELAGLSPEGAG